VRDWHSANITLERGLTGAKPRSFCRWILEMLNAQPGDEVVDLFPGTGAFGSAWEQISNPESQSRLYELEGGIEL
jgi:DNA modification methylase